MTLVLTVYSFACLAGCAIPLTQRPDDEHQAASNAASSQQEPTDVKRTRKTQTLDEKLLFYPVKYPEGEWQPEGIDYSDAWFQAADGTRLHGWYCPCPDAQITVLYAHGNAGNLSHRAGVLQILQKQLHCSVFIFDYRGYGRSEGRPTVPGILADARAARDQLSKLAHVDSSRIVLMGRSLGGAVAVQLAAESAPRALVLESTFPSLRDVARVHFPKLAWLVSARKLDSVAAIARNHAPLLQSHGDADRTVPIELGRKLYDAANTPKTWITLRGSDHNNPPPRDYYLRLGRFFQTLQ